MGLVKRQWEESLERGWDAAEKNVCADYLSGEHRTRWAGAWGPKPTGNFPITLENQGD